MNLTDVSAQGEAVIRLRNVAKHFPVRPLDMLLDFGRILLGRRPANNGYRRVTALDSVDLTIRKGERVGIIGPNGAGKTTMLQLIAGLGKPTRGSIKTTGQINAIMALSLSLRPELTGRENIYVDGEVNGKSRTEMDAQIGEIISFADIDDFIDRPVHVYSSGMSARLAFAMATHIEPEILIVDEILSVGDAGFRQKAAARIQELCHHGHILMLVSHDLNSVVEMCERVIWMDAGRVIMDGPANDVINAYRTQVRENDEALLLRDLAARIDARSNEDGVVLSLHFVEEGNSKRTIFDGDENLTLQVEIQSERRIPAVELRFLMERTDGVMMLDRLASLDGFDCGSVDGDAAFEIPFGPAAFGAGVYQVKVELLEVQEDGASRVLAEGSNILGMRRPLDDYDRPAFFVPTEWHLDKAGA